MANNIALRKEYLSGLLDQVYKLSSLTAVLDGANELAREGANANEILIPKMTMQGLANYNRQSGYVAGDAKNSEGKAVNFMIVDKQAAIQYQKHTVSKIITPDQNQDADAWKFGYRTVGIAECYDNKKDGIYVHTAV